MPSLNPEWQKRIRLAKRENRKLAKNFPEFFPEYQMLRLSEKALKDAKEAHRLASTAWKAIRG